jgi:hypothetical protein
VDNAAGVEAVTKLLQEVRRENIWNDSTIHLQGNHGAMEKTAGAEMRFKKINLVALSVLVFGNPRTLP